MDNLPSIADAMRECADMSKIREVYLGSDTPSTQIKFDYAWVRSSLPSFNIKSLIRSTRKSDIETGIHLIDQIFIAVKERRKECLYYASKPPYPEIIVALGYYKLGQYSNAKRQIEMLSRIEPDNERVREVKGLVEEKVRVQGAVGLAIVGGIAATVGVLLASIFRR